MSRPTAYTDELLADICERLSNGEPLAEICRTPGYPHPSTVRRWQVENDVIRSMVAVAREDGEEAIAAECLRLADTPCMGSIERRERVELAKPADAKEGDPAPFEMRVVEVRNEDMLGHRKLQIETRLKLLAKWNPRKWGDRMALEHDAVGNLADVIREARERAAEG